MFWKMREDDEVIIKNLIYYQTDALSAKARF